MKGVEMSDYYVEIYSYENFDSKHIETYLAHSLEEAHEIQSKAWDRGPAWDAYIYPATDLSTSEEGA